jgi:hypothetical protein
MQVAALLTRLQSQHGDDELNDEGSSDEEAPQPSNRQSRDHQPTNTGSSARDRSARPLTPVIDNSGMPGGWNPPAASNVSPISTAPDKPPRPSPNPTYSVSQSPSGFTTPAYQPPSTPSQPYTEYDDPYYQSGIGRLAPAPYPKPAEILPTGAIDSDGWEQYQYAQTNGPPYPPVAPESAASSRRRDRSDGLLGLGKKALGGRKAG